MQCDFKDDKKHGNEIHWASIIDDLTGEVCEIYVELVQVWNEGKQEGPSHLLFDEFGRVNLPWLTEPVIKGDEVFDCFGNPIDVPNGFNDECLENLKILVNKYIEENNIRWEGRSL